MKSIMKKEEQELELDRRVEIYTGSVLIEEVSGQSCYKDIVFHGRYSNYVSEFISPHIATFFDDRIFTGMDGLFSEIYVECDDEQMRVDIISEVIRKNPKIRISAKPMICGSNFGFNVFVSSTNKKQGEKSPALYSINEEVKSEN